MLNLLFQNAGPNRGRGFLAIFRHLGPLGLFFLTILDSSPIPTFGGPDLLIAILVTTRGDPWWEYALVGMVGSTIGAYFTFRLARKAGDAYLETKFGHSVLFSCMDIFKKWGTGTLVASSAIPFPFPTSMVFAAAGASDFRLSKFLGIVAISRGVRYAAIALIADRYGRDFIGILRHPTRYWGWLLVFAVIILLLIAGGILFNKRLAIRANALKEAAGGSAA
jgi:membrane protein YqaA with SNARE-associated domain